MKEIDVNPIIWAEVDACVPKRFDGKRMGDTKFKFWHVTTNNGVIFRSVFRHHCDRVLNYLRSGVEVDANGIDDAAGDKKWDVK